MFGREHITQELIKELIGYAVGIGVTTNFIDGFIVLIVNYVQNVGIVKDMKKRL